MIVYCFVYFAAVCGRIKRLKNLNQIFFTEPHIFGVTGLKISDIREGIMFTKWSLSIGFIAYLSNKGKNKR